MNYRIRNIMVYSAFAATLLATLADCSRKDEDIPVYEATPERIYDGSLYYASAGCIRCHGTNWKKGAKDFSQKLSPKKTPVDYFETITRGNEKTRKNNVAHDFQSYTDRARWAMANFLFSLAPRQKKSKNIAIHQAALEKRIAEVQAAYKAANAKNHRRWELYEKGTVSITKREAAPALDTLLQDVKLDSGIVVVKVTDEQALNVLKSEGRGATLYSNNCASCHGNNAEGATASKRFGNVDCVYNPKTAEKRKAGVNAKQCAVYVSARDLKGASVDDFKNAHQNTTGVLLPAFLTLSDEDLQEIFTHISSVTTGR